MEVGVGTGVLWLDGTEVAGGPGCLMLGTSPVYLSPSSPGENESVEQKPSEDEISNVKPSGDLSSCQFSGRFDLYKELTMLGP